ncbi:MAG: tetratricopeptide repeat protein [Planctomycetota bacterium]
MITDAIQLFRGGEVALARQLAETVVERNEEPRSTAAAHHLLAILARQGDDIELAKLELVKAVDLQPGVLELRLDLGDCLIKLDEIDAAIEHFRYAIESQPQDIELAKRVAQKLLDCDRNVPAADLLKRVVREQPRDPASQFNLGIALAANGKTREAVVHFGISLQLRPKWTAALANWMRYRAEICDWRDDWHRRVSDLVTALEQEPKQKSPSLRISQAPALPIPAHVMRQIAERETRALQRACTKLVLPHQRVRVQQSNRLRIGYLACDFRNHAKGHQTRTMFGHHDQNAFEVFTYSYGVDDGSDYRSRIQSDSEHFIDLFGCNDDQICEQILDDQIDILIDMMGYAGNGRPAVLAKRPAPVLVHFLGFPSTLGGLVDYFITDRFLAPPQSQLCNEFTEALIYLPHTYQMNDDRQPIDTAPICRSDFGLPEKGFVFAAFNTVYKVQPQIFGRWMRILHAVPGSVLWMIHDDQATIRTLRQEARRHGVDAARLVFSGITSKPRHLARHALANLFLDTNVCGAHTTATDALWAGLPLITCPGERMTERIAGSLLTTMGLHELIVNDLFEYENLAIKLGNDTDQCSRITEKLATRRADSPLFNTRARVRELESAFREIWRRHQQGLAPQTFMVG